MPKVGRIFRINTTKADPVASDGMTGQWKVCISPGNLHTSPAKPVAPSQNNREVCVSPRNVHTFPVL